jgi:hypothetical protein
VKADSFVACYAGPVLGEPVTIPSTSTADAVVNVTDCTGAEVHISVVLLTSVSVLSPGPNFSAVCHMYTHLLCFFAVRTCCPFYWWPLEAPHVFGTGSVLQRPSFRSSSVMVGWRVQVCAAGRDFLSSDSAERNSGTRRMCPGIVTFVKDRSAPSVIPEESLLCN